MTEKASDPARPADDPKESTDAAEPTNGSQVLTDLRETLRRIGDQVKLGTTKGAHTVGSGAERLAHRISGEAETEAKEAEEAADAAGKDDLRGSLLHAGEGISQAARAAIERAKREAPKAVEGMRAAGAHAAQGAKVAGRRVSTATRKVRDKVDDRLGDSDVPSRAAQVGHKAKIATESAMGKVKQAAAGAREKATDVWGRRDTVLETLEARLVELKDQLARRAKEAKERGVDFFKAHREEILALIFTAAKVAAVIGLRRLTAPREDPEEEGADKDGARRLKEKNRRLADAATILIAMTREVGKVFSYHPSALPLLKEAYEKGDESQQAVVGMLLGPSLQSDPEHGVQVIREFLESAQGVPAADSIARRSLAPLLEKDPSLIEKVLPWISATQPLVKRAALVALERRLSDKKSLTGDILAAAVVVLEDHDEEVRQALKWLLETAGRVDPAATARSLVSGLRKGKGSEKALDELLPELPEDVRDEVASLRASGAKTEEE
ncbi:MAG: DNA alkylation repair protein [Euryarchaeota archaeon]|nr:DNA alkylation repair protein [Euryarchaeota archaeon]